jgi:hypothetical protein
MDGVCFPANSKYRGKASSAESLSPGIANLAVNAVRGESLQLLALAVARNDDALGTGKFLNKKRSGPAVRV